MRIVDAYGGIVFDVDGVLIRGDAPVPGAAEVLDELDRRGVRTAFVTNNATRSPGDLAAWLGQHGLDIEPGRVVTSSLAAASLVEPGTRCLVIGMDGLREALAERGCILDDAPETAEAVVVGLDTGLDYDDLRRATVAIASGARFIGTNADASLPVEGGEVWPGNGAILAAIETATGVAPEVAGKPGPAIFEAAVERLGAGPVLMVGDRPETDIAGAAALGWDTALVLTGVSSGDAGGDAGATYVLASVADLLGERASPAG